MSSTAINSVRADSSNLLIKEIPGTSYVVTKLPHIDTTLPVLTNSGRIHIEDVRFKPERKTYIYIYIYIYFEVYIPGIRYTACCQREMN